MLRVICPYIYRWLARTGRKGHVFLRVFRLHEDRHRTRIPDTYHVIYQRDQL